MKIRNTSEEYEFIKKGIPVNYYYYDNTLLGKIKRFFKKVKKIFKK